MSCASPARPSPTPANANSRHCIANCTTESAPCSPEPSCAQMPPATSSTPIPKSACKQLDAARANLRIAGVDLRRVVYGMWPLELEQHGLWGAIAAGAIRSGAVLALPAEPPQLSPATELACYRIISEALTNIDRHAPGTLPTIAIRTDGDTIHLSVSNAGPTPDGFVAGIGITSIHDRVDELGGRAWVGPHLDGWLVEAILPLTPG